MKLNSTIQQKYGTIYEWNKENPTLLKGEIAVVDYYGDTQIKVGDGKTPFTNLDYVKMPIPEELRSNAVTVASMWDIYECAVAELLPGRVSVYGLDEHGPIDGVYLQPGSIKLRNSEVVTHQDLEDLGLLGGFSNGYYNYSSDLNYNTSDYETNHVIEIDYEHPLDIVSINGAYYTFTPDCLYATGSIRATGLVISVGSDAALYADQDSLSVNVDLYVKGKSLEEHIQDAIAPLLKEIEALKAELAKK